MTVVRIALPAAALSLFLALIGVVVVKYVRYRCRVHRDSDDGSGDDNEEEGQETVNGSFDPVSFSFGEKYNSAQAQRQLGACLPIAHSIVIIVDGGRSSSRYGLKQRSPLTARNINNNSSMAPLLLNAYWPLLVVVAVVLFASLVLANAIAFFSQMRREKRIQRKTQRLAAAAAVNAATATSKQEDNATQRERVPVTILTGFLGAGKTTLLNRILHAPSLPFKIMVLENELGAISIDHTLLRNEDADGTDRNVRALAKDGIYVMQNGCMCCTASKTSKSSELERILDYLLRIVNEDGFDYLVVETTGLADPGPIIETFLRLRASRFRLDAVVTMVDTYAANRFWSEDEHAYTFPIELQKQLLYADIVALNKMDLVDNTQVHRLKQAITSINEEARMHTSVNAELDLAHIIDVNTFDAVKFREHRGGDDDAGHDSDKNEEDKDSHSHGLHTRGAHTSGINTVHFEMEAELDIARFGEWLAAVVDEYSKSDVLRIKGVVAVANDAHRCIVQCVLDTYTVAPSVEWRAQEKRVSKLVVIGKHLNRRVLEAGFLNCIANSSGEQTGQQVAYDQESKKDV